MLRDSPPVRPRSPEWIPALIAGSGVVFTLSFSVETFLLYENGFVRSEDFVVSLFLLLVAAMPLVAGGYWLSRSGLPPERYPRIANWVAGGLVGFLLINVPMIAVWNLGGFAAAFGWGRWAANFGAAGGMVLGIVEARAIQRELDAQRASIRAEAAENQQQWLDYLNGLLRHEVLNSANVITGYAELLLEDDDLDDEARKHLERISRQGEDMTQVIRDVQVLIESASDADRLGPRNLSALLDDELDQLRDVAGSVTVDASIPDGVFVRADDLLPRVFSNLLRNAVEHNDGDRPRVEVTVERDAETVTVSVDDDGPGIPESERASLFERSDNTGSSHGLGLYLVRTLVERYGGTVELAETGPDGSRFTVELPTADPPADDSLATESIAAGRDDRPRDRLRGGNAASGNDRDEGRSRCDRAGEGSPRLTD
ncbi:MULTISPECIES: HAMP domain-containing sensor histidine kinase [Halorussus]|uniref:sensor histidine kinase n=1 Tax=Halorussus TaxID=1070314 RepID=UPI000E2179AC|nr:MULTISPECIES: HAMP domain-containing sensor histidine kinase [Halorussus]NHN58717.1 HAMP domain-containing histidine kinase [Halorussus sp. JP-T4]